jgi:hypothetical protein
MSRFDASARTVLFAALLAALPAFAQSAGVKREVVGNRTSENIPEIPAALLEQLNRYQNTRGAGLAGWTKDGCLLISTRFAETAQAHRVCQPLGMREQLTFYPEPVAGLTPAPANAWRDGFVFAKDRGGDEFSQLYWFDTGSRSVTLLTDGKRSQNGGTTLSRDGGLMAYSSTSRNGTDRDVWLRNTRSGETKLLVDAGGNWSPMDFSPDGSRLLVMKYVSAAESYPGVVDVATGKLALFPVDGGKASFGGFAFAPDGKAVYFISDEPLRGKPQEFQTLRYHDPASGTLEVLSSRIAWDIEGFTLADDGRHLAYVSNEDGISKLHVLSLPSHNEIRLPALPIGVIGGIAFSPDGKRLAFSLNSATSPSDVHVIDLGSATLARWTQSEVGGLDAATFVAPTLVRYPTFDKVDGQAAHDPGVLLQAVQAVEERQVSGGDQHPRRSGRTVAADLQRQRAIPGQRTGRGAAGAERARLHRLRQDLPVAGQRREARGFGQGHRRATGLDRQAARTGCLARRRDRRQLRRLHGAVVADALQRPHPRRRGRGRHLALRHLPEEHRELPPRPAPRGIRRRARPGDGQGVRTDLAAQPCGQITSPLFVAQGRNDPRVPWTEAEQIVKAVRGNGQPVWYLLYADEGHGFAKKGNSDWFGAATILFWQQHLLND